MARDEDVLLIEVAWSPQAREALLVTLKLPAGSRVRDALRESGVADTIDAAAMPPVGIWGKVCTLDDPLRDRDRVELYRPLKVDPKEARRQRYQSQRGQKAR